MKTLFKLKNVFTTILLLLVMSLPLRQVSADSLPKSSSTGMGYVYRFWSDIFHGHFYTLSYDEATKVNETDTNWKYEKVAFSGFSTQQADTIPLYRFWSDNFRGHFYTADESEMTKVKNTDTNWKYEMVAFYVYPTTYTGSAKTVYRFWSPVFKHHFYTADEAEMTKVKDTDRNWTYEGPAFKVPNENSNFNTMCPYNQYNDGKGNCVTLDKLCKDKYGEGSYSKSYDSNANYNTCDCLNGYKWQGSYCVSEEYNLPSYDYELSCDEVGGLSIFGYDNYNDNYKFIGSIANEFSSLSIGNEFGYGNEFKSDSLFNEFGTYGNMFGSYSAYNEFSYKPPVLIDAYNQVKGYVTKNTLKIPYIDPDHAKNCAKNTFSSPIYDHEDKTFIIQ